KQAFNYLGMLSADVPLGKLKELENDPDIAFISPDLPVLATADGHVEATSGTSQIRSAVTGTTLDGRGIGIAVIDSGIDKTHNLLKASTGHPGVTYEQDFTGANDPKDYYGHGTHVATLLAGSNAENGYYEGIAPGANLISLKVLDANGSGSTSNIIAAINWC